MVVPSFIPDSILDHCVAALLDQGKPVEDCIAGFPEHEASLVPLLRLATRLRAAGTYHAPAEFRMAAAARINNQIGAAAVHPAPIWTRLLGWAGARREVVDQQPVGSPVRLRFSVVYVTVLLVLVLSLAGWGVAYAAGQALPGDALYPVKRRVEGIRLLISTAPAENTRLQIALTQERFAEVISLAKEQRMPDFSTAIQGYTHQLSTAMTTLADEQRLAHDDQVSLSQLLLEDLVDNEIQLTSLLSALPEEGSVPGEIRDEIQAAVILIHGSYARMRDWSGLPPVPPPDSSPSLPGGMATTSTRTAVPSPSSTPVPPRASRTPVPDSDSSEMNEMFTEWPTEWGPLQETPEPQWTEVNMPWPTEVPLPSAWPTDLPPLPTTIEDFWPGELPPPPPVTDIPGEDPPEWPDDPDDADGWPPEE